jgi:anti-sigma regulatory factor (Ser/Thr protein kinase)
MEVSEDIRVAVTEASDASEVRRVAADLASRLGFGETDAGRVAIVATELATNLVKHAGGGELVIGGIRDGDVPVVSLLALDRGRGIARLHESLRDGFSTTGTAGNGLGAIARLSDRLDVFSAPGAGTGVVAEVHPGTRGVRTPGLAVGGLSVPVAGEDVCGDGWAFVEHEGRAVLLVVDGLGHGAGAAEAAVHATQIFRRDVRLGPEELMGRLHDGLRATRGAAAAIAEVDRRRGLVRYVGVGNIGATVLVDGTTRSLVSLHGTLGHDVRKLREFQYPWPSGALLVLHSDGLVTHWSLDGYAGLTRRHPRLIAGVLYRDFKRGRDDATVVVLREAE